MALGQCDYVLRDIMTVTGIMISDLGLTFGRCVARGTFVSFTPTVSLVNGLGWEAPMLEAAQNIAKHVSVIARDTSSGFGVALSPTQVAALVVQLKKGGALSYSVITPVMTVVGSSGLIDVALTGSHLDTLGVAAVNIVGANIFPIDLLVDVIAVNKNDAVRAGLTSLPNATAAAAGGLPTVGATIPNAVAGTSAGLALKQNVDDGVTTVDNHTDSATAGVTTAVNAHTDSATAGMTSAVNAHTDSVGASILSALPSSTAVRDAVLNALLADHATPGTVADGIAIAAGLLQGNFMMDNVTNGADGLTAARLRIWRDGGSVPGTGGGVGEREFAAFEVLTTYTAPGKVLVHRVARVT